MQLGFPRLKVGMYATLRIRVRVIRIPGPRDGPMGTSTHQPMGTSTRLERTCSWTAHVVCQVLKLVVFLRSSLTFVQSTNLSLAT